MLFVSRLYLPKMAGEPYFLLYIFQYYIFVLLCVLHPYHNANTPINTMSHVSHWFMRYKITVAVGISVVFSYELLTRSKIILKVKPRPFENSARQVPNDGFSPHCVSFGGFPSTSLM